MCFAHIPVHPVAASYMGVSWDYKQALAVLRASQPGTVVGFFAGHHHRDGYAADVCDASSESLIHHVMVPSPLVNHHLSPTTARIRGRPHADVIRAYDEPDIVAARERLRAAELATNAHFVTPISNDGDGSDTSEAEVTPESCAPFGTVHVGQDAVQIVGHGAMQSRTFSLKR